MSNYTSADRLHEILSGLLRFVNSHPVTAFRSIFSLDNNVSLEDIYKLHMKTVELSSNLRKMSKALGGRTAARFGPNIEKIQEALLSIDLERSNGLDSFSKKLSNGAAMTGLNMFAGYIADHNIEREVKQEDLELIQQEINELICTIENSTIDADFKKSLIANLNSLILSIQEYNFFGSATISDIIQRTTGQTTLQLLQNEQTEETKSIIQLVFEKMRNFNTIISFTTTVNQAFPFIVGAILPALTGG